MTEFYVSIDGKEILAYNSCTRQAIHFYRPYRRDKIIKSWSDDYKWYQTQHLDSTWKHGKLYENISLEEALEIEFFGDKEIIDDD